jgi:hypothetical protein
MTVFLVKVLIRVTPTSSEKSGTLRKKNFFQLPSTPYSRIECLSLSASQPQSNICGVGKEPTLKVESHLRLQAGRRRYDIQHNDTQHNDIQHYNR